MKSSIKCFIYRETRPADCNTVYDNPSEVSQIPCEELLTNYVTFIDDSTVRLNEGLILLFNEFCFLGERGEELNVLCKEAYRVFFLVKPGSRFYEKTLLGFLYSNKRNVRKIKADGRGIVIAVIHYPMSKPERACILYKSP